MTTTQQQKIFMTDLESLKGCKFVSFTYTSKGTGETAKILCSLGVSYEKAKTRDVQKLNAFVPENDIQETAKIQLIQSLIAPDAVRSQAQTDCKTPIIENKLDFFPETGSIALWAFLIKKTVLVPGEYKKTKSAPLTIEKNNIKKSLNFSSAKFRRYIIENIASIRINGKTLEIN